jgi:hypothetical protein
MCKKLKCFYLFYFILFYFILFYFILFYFILFLYFYILFCKFVMDLLRYWFGVSGGRFVALLRISSFVDFHLE